MILTLPLSRLFAHVRRETETDLAVVKAVRQFIATAH